MRTTVWLTSAVTSAFCLGLTAPAMAQANDPQADIVARQDAERPGVLIFDPAFFADKFAKPMALLRGNYYPARPDWAGDKDFGIAAHTDYGCLTLLATDGSPGLEVQTRKSEWVSVNASPGTFIINFGEMLQMWSGGRVVATPHRVIGGDKARISIPFFFNPQHDVNVAPPDLDEVRLAGEHLSRRYDQTYVHRQSPAKQSL